MSSSIDDLAVPAQTEPEAAESVNFLLCAVCTQTGIETAPGSHCFETDFPRSLRDARYTPNGQWVRVAESAMRDERDSIGGKLDARLGDRASRRLDLLRDAVVGDRNAGSGAECRA